MIVLLQEFGTPVRWQCSVCGDEGVISNWEDSPFVLAATDGDLDALIDSLAAEANHETSRRRHRRLDAAFDALNAAAQTSKSG